MHGEESCCTGEGDCWQPPNELVRGRGVSHCEADIGENMSIGRFLQDSSFSIYTYTDVVQQLKVYICSHLECLPCSSYYTVLLYLFLCHNNS